MRKREEIWDGISGETNTRDLAIDLLEVLLDCRDLLSERHTRREKKENCKECGGSGYVLHLPDDRYPFETAIKNMIPTKVPCPTCQPANTN